MQAIIGTKIQSNDPTLEYAYLLHTRVLSLVE